MSFCEDFFMQIRCVGLRSKYFRFRSAMEEVAVKSVGLADILHNSSYNYARNNKTRRRQPKGMLL